MDHWNFVLAAYGVTGLIVGAMILWVAADYRALTRRGSETGGRENARIDAA